jgi:hypothetical protein
MHPCGMKQKRRDDGAGLPPGNPAFSLPPGIIAECRRDKNRPG